MTKAAEKRRQEVLDAREVYNSHSDADRRRLTLRFMEEVPPINEDYVKRECPDLLRKAEKYNAKRRIAASDADIDALVELKDEIQAAAA